MCSRKSGQTGWGKVRLIPVHPGLSRVPLAGTRLASRGRLAAFLALVIWTPLELAWAANGDVLQISPVLAGTDIVDLTQDGDGSFWVLGAHGESTPTHSLYHVSSDFGQELGTLPNPHPPGSFPSVTTNRGIAYRDLSVTLLVLSHVGPRPSRSFEIREVDKDGNEIQVSAFTVVLDANQDAGADLHGLSYDIFSRDFWTMDVTNDRLLQVRTDGTISRRILLPGKDSPQTFVHGRGVAFANEGVDSFLFVPSGDIFTVGPSKILEVTTDGIVTVDGLASELTGVEVPLADVTNGDLRGIQTFTNVSTAPRDRVAIVGSGGLIYELDRTVSDPAPPSEVKCSTTLSNQVELSWVNQGPGLNGRYLDKIQIVRNGVPLSFISRSAVTFTDTTPAQGTATYSVRGFDSSSSSSDESCECRVTVGKGALVSWRAFPGVSCYGVTENPATGEIFVTDDSRGTISRFDADLNLLEELDAVPDEPGAITFVPEIELGVLVRKTFNNLLAVVEGSGRRISFVEASDPDGPEFGGISLSGLNDVPNPKITGLTFLDSVKEFVVAEESTGMLYVLNDRGQRLNPGGECQPTPFLIDAPLDGGVTFDPLIGTFLVGFQDGIIRELNEPNDPMNKEDISTCSPSGFGIPLDSLRLKFDETVFLGGIQISDNTLLVCSPKTNALFRVLIFPFSPDFVRGDFNRDQAVTITDAHDIAFYLFRNGPAPPCNDAADANDDGFLGISDTIYLLHALFITGSPQPPEPFPLAGNDPTFRDGLGCAQ